MRAVEPCASLHARGGDVLDLIVIFVLYGIVLFAFGWFGGWRAAGKSVEDWGRWNSVLRRRAGSS
jgi:hypothetical protein